MLLYDNTAKTCLQYESQKLEWCQSFKGYLIPYLTQKFLDIWGLPLLCWHYSTMQTARCEGSCSTQVPRWHCLVSLHRGIGVRSAILAQTCCHHWSQWPGAPAAAATQCTLSSAKNREHSQPAWDHCSALLSMPAQGIEPKRLHFQMAPEELGPLQPSPEMDF